MDPADPVVDGLTTAEAAARLARGGPNVLPTAGPRSTWTILFDVVREPMFLLLLVCGALYVVLGDIQDALMLVGFVIVVIVITLIQQRRSERALEALRDLSSPRALVIRDGVRARIAGRDVVPGDLLVVAEGDRVAADAVLLTGNNVSVDESLLTGESVPVGKRAAPSGSPAPAVMGAAGGDGSPYLFSGTLMVGGSGLARVLGTGASTALGRIGAALASVVEEPTRIQKETAQVVRRLAVIGLACALFVTVAFALTHDGDWLHALLAGLTLAMAILPEELPVMLVIFLGLGAWRLAQQQVLTRRVPAIETLGAATVLCVDKTGTLTENRMALAILAVDGAEADLRGPPGAALPEVFHGLVEYAALASHREPFDPMEKAIRETLQRLLADTEHVHPEWVLVDEYPLSPELLAMSRVWRSTRASTYVIAAKGAPEAIVDLCHLPTEQRDAVADRVTGLAERGLRVLGVARAVLSAASLPDHQHAFEFEYLGLLGLADPVRPAVPAALAEGRAAGVRTLMITGDHPATAMAIARQIGLDTSTGSVTGAELEALSSAALRVKVRTVNVFCRVSPDHKLRLVEALKANGEITAMTGDGVNDAPALKAAHIGIAMGGRGTDVARESASLVLLDDDFTSIVRAIRLGRRIYDNLKKAICFTLAVHIPIIGLSVMPVLFGWPLVLQPVHILFLQLVIDPTCSIVFEVEREDPDIMKRPPRALTARLFDAETLWVGLLQGILVTGLVTAVSRFGAADPDAVRALAFLSLVLSSIALIAVNRSRTRTAWSMFGVRNAALGWISGATLVMLAVLMAIPALRSIFGFGPLTPQQIALAVGAATGSLIGCEVVKRLVPVRRAATPD
jgi:Ca2+-transporting ATPase